MPRASAAASKTSAPTTPRVDPMAEAACEAEAMAEPGAALSVGGLDPLAHRCGALLGEIAGSNRSIDGRDGGRLARRR